MDTGLSIALGVIGGGIITMSTAFFIEWIKKPRFLFNIATPVDMNYPGQIKQVRFGGINVTNKKIPCFFRFIQRNTANDCGGEIQVFDSNNNAIFQRPMKIRWSGSPEPVMPQMQFINQTVRIIDIYRIMEYSKIDITPGSTEKFDVVGKFDSDTDCYGWNNESYINGWRNPQTKIPLGQYSVLITLNLSGVKMIKKYKLTNAPLRINTILSE